MARRIITLLEPRPRLPADYVWEPTWLEPGHAAKQLGIDLEASTAQLRLLFPPDECRRIAERGQGELVEGLFWGDGWSNDVAHLLGLGADLAVCRDWASHDSLVKDLRHIEQHDGARFEVGIWAGLTRIGANPTHLPPDMAQKAPDLLLEDDGRVVAFEVKSGGVANSQRNYRILEHALEQGATLGGGFELRHLLRFFPGSELVRAFRSLEPKTFHNLWSVRVRAGMAAWYNGRVSRLAIGPLSVVPGLGRARLLELPDDGSVWSLDIVGLNPGDPEKELARAARKVREAGAQLAQFESADVRVAVLWVSSVDVPAKEVVEELALSPYLRRSPPRGVDWLVLFNSHAARTGRWSAEAAATRLSECDYDIRDARWFEGLTAWKGTM